MAGTSRNWLGHKSLLHWGRIKSHVRSQAIGYDTPLYMPGMQLIWHLCCRLGFTLSTGTGFMTCDNGANIEDSSNVGGFCDNLPLNDAEGFNAVGRAAPVFKINAYAAHAQMCRHAHAHTHHAHARTHARARARTHKPQSHDTSIGLDLPLMLLAQWAVLQLGTALPSASASRHLLCSLEMSMA